MLAVMAMLITIIYMVVGLIKPQSSKLAGKEKTRKNVLIRAAALIGGCFVLIMVTAMILPAPEKEKSPAVQQSQAQPAQPKQEKLPTPEEQIAALYAKQEKEAKKLLERRKDEAWRDCRDYIDISVTRPRTVDIGMFDSQKTVRDKKIVIIIDFTAKNALDIALPLRAYCEYWQEDMTRTAARIINR